MSDLITTAQDSFRDQCIEVYVGATSALSGMVQRSREATGQTAAEYMGVLLVISVIIAAVSKTELGDKIYDELTSLVESISKGESGKG